jgi:serine/threonine protein phosphatase PrpC
MHRFDSGSRTDVGRLRHGNEDAFVVGRRLWAVADGMGGHAAGEVASAVAAHAMQRLDAAGEVRALDVRDVTVAVRDANTRILDHAAHHRRSRGLGTTLTGLALVRDDGQERWCVFNVGDSRVYRMADGVLERLTVDHSEVEELIVGGVLTPEQARSYPRRNIVTRCLGTRPAPEVDVRVLEPEPGERFVLCSDGLNSELRDPEIESILVRNPDAQGAADALVKAALSAGGRDNVTVVVLNVDAPDAGIESA